MFLSSLLAASSVLLATALADSSPYSKFIDDANSLLAAATGNYAAQLNALYGWQATQTAVPSGDVDSQYQEYLNAFMTTTSAPLPAWVTAVPSSLQPIATSFLQAEASLVIQDIAPIVSQNNAAGSVNSAGQAAPATTSLKTTVVPTPATSATASSGFVSGPANTTSSQMSGNGTAPSLSAKTTATAPITSITTASGSPTKSVTPLVTTFNKTSEAEKPAGVAAAAAVVGILGIVVLL
ncbi:hypothetical protein HO173_010094 [Letharia columbiana]|uniref:Uncharacterized protein n=1 Tax=Letharia columbiana TaxID=112416 RepID=A0A8H6FNH2_9LECA|nr:uncharacterized protein HO173_010094 [Letharia columbiana]KAF6231792.1 hypothetical protein HO173_010094 [Letharia columbiana]